MNVNIELFLLARVGGWSERQVAYNKCRTIYDGRRVRSVYTPTRVYTTRTRGKRLPNDRGFLSLRTGDRCVEYYEWREAHFFAVCVSWTPDFSCSRSEGILTVVKKKKNTRNWFGLRGCDQANVLYVPISAHLFFSIA